jgi:hypothetical protein
LWNLLEKIIDEVCYRNVLDIPHGPQESPWWEISRGEILVVARRLLESDEVRLTTKEATQKYLDDMKTGDSREDRGSPVASAAEESPQRYPPGDKNPRGSSPYLKSMDGATDD